MHEKVSTNWSTILSKKLAISSRKAIKKAVIFSQILETFISSEVHTWRGAGNKKSSRHRTKGTEVEDHGWVSVAVCFLYFRREVWIFFFFWRTKSASNLTDHGNCNCGCLWSKSTFLDPNYRNNDNSAPIQHQYGYRNQFACHSTLSLSSRKASSKFSSFWGAFCSNMV